MDSCLGGWLEVAIACHYRFPVEWDGLVTRDSSESVSSTKSSGTVSSTDSQVIRSRQQSQVG